MKLEVWGVRTLHARMPLMSAKKRNESMFVWKEMREKHTFEIVVDHVRRRRPEGRGMVCLRESDLRSTVQCVSRTGSGEFLWRLLSADNFQIWISEWPRGAYVI